MFYTVTDLEKMRDGLLGEGKQNWKLYNNSLFFDLKSYIWNKAFNISLTKLFKKQNKTKHEVHIESAVS